MSNQFDFFFRTMWHIQDLFPLLLELSMTYGVVRVFEGHFCLNNKKLFIISLEKLFHSLYIFYGGYGRIP